MEWPEDKMLQLIAAYERKPLLWDSKHKDHYRKYLKENAWKEISDEVNVSEAQCKKKMVSLLASHRRERNRTKISKKKGKEIYNSRWFAYEAFRFLGNEERKLHKRLTMDTNGIMEVEENIKAVVIPLDPIERKATPVEKKETTAFPRFRPIKPKEKEGNISSSTLNLVQQQLSNLPLPAQKMEEKPSQPNEIDSFFTYVAVKVRKYSPEVQKRVQHSVFEILMKADTGMLDWPSSPMYAQSYISYPHQEQPRSSYPSQSRPSFSANSTEQSPDASTASEDVEDFK